MRIKVLVSLGVLALAVACVVSILALNITGAAGEDTGSNSCSVVEAGPAGPAGNVLKVDLGVHNDVLVYTDAGRIRVFEFPAIDIYSLSAFEDLCEGYPTVHNVDSIRIVPRSDPGLRFPPDVVIDESGRPLYDHGLVADGTGGPLAPGATPERQGSEIELTVASRDVKRRPDRPVFLFRSPPKNAFVNGGRVPNGAMGFNLNTRADGALQDVDVNLGFTNEGLAKRYSVGLIGGTGPNRISTAGGPGFAGPIGHLSIVTIRGGPAKDILLGHPGGDHLIAESGDDLLRGGAGNDSNTCCGNEGLEDGPGNDRVFGGPGIDVIGGGGADEVHGGSGADWFYERDGARDVVDCGPDMEQSVQTEAIDRLTSCRAGKPSAPQGRHP